jgi:HK97 family phage major capsid protein
MPEKTRKQIEQEFEAKQGQLAKVFAEARTEDGQLDYNQVECFAEIADGPGKSIAVAEKVKAMDAELNELGGRIETLRAADEAARAHESREKTIRRPIHSAPGDHRAAADAARRLKSIGEIVTADRKFEEWAKSGAGGGVSFSLDDYWPSDGLARGMSFPTLQSKALFETTAGWAPESVRLPGFVEAVTRPVQLIDIIPMGQTGQEAIVYMEETTRTHAAAEKAEGVAFAESTFALTEKSSNVRKITDSVPVTDEQLEDVAMVESYLNGRLMFGIRQRLDGQVLVGNGTPPNLRGIKNVVGIQTQAKGADPVQDAFYKAMTLIRLTGRAMPTHHVIHPTDWQDIRLTRTADGIYVWGNPSEAGPERMWGLPVIQSDADAAGTGYVGSFLPAWISLFERRGIDIQVGYTGTQFVEGKRTIRADGRWALVLFRPAAFCSVTGI